MVYETSDGKFITRGSDMQNSTAATRSEVPEEESPRATHTMTDDETTDKTSVAERQVEALEQIAEELRFQNGVLLLLADELTEASYSQETLANEADSYVEQRDQSTKPGLWRYGNE